MRFKTHGEVFEHLLGGGKIIHKNAKRNDEYLCLGVNNMIIAGNGGHFTHIEFDFPCMWQKYEEPKKKKKITLYRYTYNIGTEIYQSYWGSKVPETGKVNPILTETKEIEVDE